MVSVSRIIGAIAALLLFSAIGSPLNSLLSTEGTALSMVLTYVEYLIFMAVGALAGEHFLSWLKRHSSG